MSQLTFQRSKIPLVPRMFPVWDFVVGLFVRKAMLNLGCTVISNHAKIH